MHPKMRILRAFRSNIDLSIEEFLDQKNILFFLKIVDFDTLNVRNVPDDKNKRTVL